MINKQNLNRFQAINRLCNVMVNAQELVEDLEALEEVGLFKQDLKQTVKRAKELCAKSVTQIFNAGLNDDELKGKSEEEIEELKTKNELTNKEVIILYNNQLEARKQFFQLTFNERAHLIEVLKSLYIDKVLEEERGRQTEQDSGII